MSDLTEDEAAYAHAQIAHDLQTTVSTWQNLRHEAQERAQALEKLTRHVRRAVTNGKWWDLEGILEQEQIELLCEVEPGERLTLLDEVWEL